MALRRFVYLFSRNDHKLAEFQRAFDKYGIDVLRVEPAAGATHPAAAEVRDLLDGKPLHDNREEYGLAEEDRVRVLAVLKETSKLLEFGTDREAKHRHLARVLHTSQLVAIRSPTKAERKDAALLASAGTEKDVDAVSAMLGLDHAKQILEDGVVEMQYEHTTEGYLDLKAGGDGEKEGAGFGWDNIFVPRFVHKPFSQLATEGYKYSSRDQVLSQYLRDHVYYKSRVDWRFAPQKQERTIDFATDCGAYFQGNPYFNSQHAVNRGIQNSWKHTVNSGVFFRSAKNRREKTYWWPNLAGLPLTPKRDPVHEVTFLAHDVGHFNVPDLINTGKNPTDLKRRVYLAWRILSEAVTMTQADMVFIDGLRASGVEYDYSARKIFPLLEDAGVDLSVADTIKDPREARIATRKLCLQLLHANVRFCLHGDDGAYRELIAANLNNDGNTTNLQAFKAKYEPFMIEDYRWTAHNYTCQLERREEFSRWWDSVEDLREPLSLQMMSVEDCMAMAGISEGDSVGNRDLVQRVFDVVVASSLDKGWLSVEPVQLVSPDLARARGFSRWLMGCLMLFSRYHFLHDSGIYLEKLRQFMIDHADGMTVEDIAAARSFYEQFVSTLYSRSLISEDDLRTFSEIFPLVDPVFVFYDMDISRYPQLSELSEYLLGEHYDK